MITMKLVLIESPYAGDVEKNVAYARACMLDCLKRGEAPYASHLLFTQVLDDTLPDERKLGIEAGLAWGARADRTAVYVDRGVSKGMLLGIERAITEHRPVELRSLELRSEDECYDLLPPAIRARLLEMATENLLRLIDDKLPSLKPNTLPSPPPELHENPMLTVGAKVAEALAKRGRTDVNILEDGSRAELTIGGRHVFVYVEAHAIGVRVGHGHAMLDKHSTAGEVSSEIERLLQTERRGT